LVDVDEAVAALLGRVAASAASIVADGVAIVACLTRLDDAVAATRR
jgi:hypothetical protein